MATTTGAGASVRVLIIDLLVSPLCFQVAAVSPSSTLPLWSFDKELASGKSVTIAVAQLSNVKLSLELNGAFGLIPVKDRGRYLLINNGNSAFPSDLVKASFITNMF